MNFLIKIPNAYVPEQEYIIHTIFDYFWGHSVTVEPHGRNVVEIRNLSDDGMITVSSDLFLTPHDKWLKPESLPSQPLKMAKFTVSSLNPVLTVDEIPIIYGKVFNRSEIVKPEDQLVSLGIDVFGSAFFMLSRYEEMVKKELDPLDRFPAEASLAFQEDFLQRPIINEYLEILWACLKKAWPDAKRKKHEFTVSLSHDVDAPYKYALYNAPKMGKKTIKTSLREGLKSAGRELNRWRKVKKNNIDADPYNTFDEIMDISEQHNLKSAFYFITSHTEKSKDGNYQINQPIIKQILNRIHERGHEIGLHPSYNSYDREGQIKHEYQKLKEVCNTLNIKQEHWGGRQHYLRWKTPDTFQYWEDAGLDYDSTLSYAGHAGFRCGICYPYPVFNIESREKLSLLEKPLIVMEATVLDDRYMGLKNNHEKAYHAMALLKDRCKLFNGTFTLLWHNNRFLDKEEKEIYKQILQY